MKKVLSTALVAGMLAFVACGPSAEEKAAMEKAKQDSIAAVQQKAMQDSMDAAKAAMDKMKADSMAMVQQKAMQDSMDAASKKPMKKGKKK